MRTIRTNTNPRATDVAPQLQSVLNANGMQAHISMTETGIYQLVTMSHNSSQPRYYNINQKQLEALMNGGTTVWDKNAYNTFVSIVKNDYYIPGSFVAARNANSPVNMGLNGHRLNVGEYGYMGDPRFRPFSGPGFGRFDNSIFGMLFGRDRYHVRRINDRPFFANSAPVVIDRPDGRLKPGELKTGSYGFYDKGNQQQDALANMKVESKPKELVRPKGQAERLSDIYSPDLTLTPETFQHLLASHGVVIDEKNKLLTIKSSSVNKDCQYSLTDEEVKKLMAEKFKNTGKKSSTKNAVSIDERLAILNNVIKADFSDKITRDQLNTKDYVSIHLTPEKEKEIFAKEVASQHYTTTTSDIIDLQNMREDYHSGYIDKWNSIGVVDGRTLNPNEGFYLPVKDGRRVTVGEIQAYPTHDGVKPSFRMTAVINGQVMSHEISKEDYLKFINYEDKYRLQLFDKVFDEVKIKNASNGELQDNVKSGNLTTANGVVTLNGDYSLVSEKSSAVITSATAWKDEISGNYLMNVRTNKDVGMWSFKITEAQYNNFKYSTDEERAKLLTNMIPLTDENKEKMKVVASNTLYQGGYTRGQNANIPPSLAKVLKDLKAAGLGYEIITSSNTSEQERFDAIKKGLQKLQDYGQANGKDVKMPSDSEIWQMLKENPDPRKLPSVETRTKETVLYGKEVINLNDLREQTKINLLGDASINGESLNNIKASKEWKRSGEHGRATEVGDIAVERIKDANGNAVEGKYKMTAVIDGNVFSHEITQKQYDKFLAINDYQRMKLFDKIFPEVEMKTKPESRFNLGAAILAAVTVGADVVAGLSAPPRPRPEIYESAPVFHKPGVVSPQAVSAAVYESLAEQPGRGQNEGMGMGR